MMGRLDGTSARWGPEQELHVTINELLEDHSPRIRSLVERIRKIIVVAVPEVEERINPGWHAITVHTKEAGFLCGVFPYEDTVKIYFENGRMLPDPDGLFSAFGSRTGQIVLRSRREVNTEGITLLLHEAVEFGIRVKSIRTSGHRKKLQAKRRQQEVDPSIDRGNRDRGKRRQA
jgi:hypothetical protein